MVSPGASEFIPAACGIGHTGTTHGLCAGRYLFPDRGTGTGRRGVRRQKEIRMGRAVDDNPYADFHDFHFTVVVASEGTRMASTTSPSCSS